MMKRKKLLPVRQKVALGRKKRKRNKKDYCEAFCVPHKRNK